MSGDFRSICESIVNEDGDLLQPLVKDENDWMCSEYSILNDCDDNIASHLKSEGKFADKSCAIATVSVKPGITLLTKEDDSSSPVVINIGYCDGFGEITSAKNSSGYLLEIPVVLLDPRKENYEPDYKIALGLISQYSKDHEKANELWILDVFVSPVCITVSKDNITFKNTLIEVIVNEIKKNFKLDVATVKFISFGTYIGDINVSLLKIQKEIANNSLKVTKLSLQLKQLMMIPSEMTPRDETFLTPEYKLKHVQHPTLQDYSTISQEQIMVSRPDALALDIKLPRVIHSSDIDVNVRGKELVLKTMGKMKYVLELKFPYEVEEDPSSAKFYPETGVLAIEFATIKLSQSSPALSTDSGIECDSEYRTNSDMDNSSVSSQEEYFCTKPNFNDDKSDSDTKVNSEHCVLAPCMFSQNEEYLHISIPHMNIITNSIKLEYKNEHTFSFQYISEGSGFAPILFGGEINIEAHSIKENSLKFSLIDKKLDIEVEKEHTTIWDGILFGLKDKLSHTKVPVLHGNETSSVEVRKQPDCCSSEVNNEELIVSNTIKEECNDITCGKTSELRTGVDEAEELVHKLHVEDDKRKCLQEYNIDNKVNSFSSGNEELVNWHENLEQCNGTEEDNDIGEDANCGVHGIKIVRRRLTSDCFLTGSWPKGILKGRSRSLSDSHVDASFFSGSPLDFEDAFQEDDESEVEAIGSISPTTKKSVRFNDLVSKQVFRVNASILGQRAKNQKKALQKKRARERKGSDGTANICEGSPLSNVTISTTEEDSNTDVDIALVSNSKSQKSRKKKHEGGKQYKNKGKGKQKIPTLSSDMIFQLDDC